HEEDPHADQQQHREPRDEDLREEALLFLRLGFDLDAVLYEIAHHPDVAGAVRDVALLVGRHPFDRTTLDARRFHLAAFGRVHELGIRHGILCALARIELLDHREHDEADHEPDADGFHQIVQTLLLAALKVARAPAPGQHTPIHYVYRKQLDSSASTVPRPPKQGSFRAKSDDFDQVLAGGLDVHSLVESPFGDNENLPAAITRCLGLAYVRLDEMLCHRTLEFCQTG